ncbi:hypothetical protein JCM8547_008722 [Rhodosporidiobolus lusitaniae]
MSDSARCAEYIPLEGNADGSVLHQPRRPKRSSISPLRFCIGFCGLLGVAIVGLIVYGIVSFARSTYKDISKPHLDIHANASLHQPIVMRDEQHIVRSFFGRKVLGGVERFDLKASIWGRLGEFEEGGKPHDEPWKVIYEDIVLRDIDISTKAISAIQPVTISREQMASITRTSNSSLIASFVMLPAQHQLDYSINHHAYRTIRNMSVFGEMAAYPPVKVELDGGSESVLSHFLAGGVTASGILNRWIHKTANTSGLPAGAEPVWSERNETFLKTRNWVSMANDFAVYNLTSFNASLSRRKSFRDRRCAGSTSFAGDCARKFSADGHFENLVQFDDAINEDTLTATQVGWRYGPFLTGGAAHAGPKDYVKVPENVTEDFTFDWHITWSSVSPAMLSLGSDFLNEMTNQHLPSNKTAVDIASGHDLLEILHSFFGHRYQTHGHPRTRFVLRFAQFLLSFVEMPLDAFYWVTRSFSTGIAVFPTLLDVSLGLIGSLAAFVEQYKEIGVAGATMGPGVIVAYLITAAVSLVNLAFRIEWNWGGPLGWFLIGFTRRRPTRSELKSKRVEAGFPWQYQVAVFLVLYLLKRFGPELPHIVSANPPKPGPPAVDQAVSWLKFLTKEVFDLGSAPQFALGKTASITQIILNHRTSRFAGQHRLAAFTSFGHTLLEHLPTVFTSFFGLWEMRSPVKWRHAFVLVLSGIEAWQALRLPVVPQDEPEEDE